MVQFTLEGLPPSSNHAYFDRIVRVKDRSIVKRVLATAGRSYKRKVQSRLIKNYPDVLAIMKPNIPLGIAYSLNSPSFLNSTWPKKAESRYKEFDGPNREKLLIDAIASAGGIDDSCFWQVIINKHQIHIDAQEETNVWIWNIEEESTIPYGLFQYFNGMQLY